VPVDWRAKVELFEQIRREYKHGEGTIRGVSRQFGIHRRMVREALRSALPTKRKQTKRACPKLGPVKDFIDAILESDRRAPRKQRHTAHRIHQRLKAELPGREVSESTVRRYVGIRKHEMGWAAREIFVPQSYAWGSKAQADWYEAVAELEGERCTLQVFSLRSMASGAAFHRAYRRATQKAFLEAHELAFRYFGGVFRQVRYDNLKSAVKKILQGYQREETSRFIAFRSHWGFAAEFCNPGRGNEKGGVEGEVGYFRRNHWTPVPQARSLQELNQSLEAACRQDEDRHIQGREPCVGAAMALERASAPAAGGRLRVGGDELSRGGRERVRESADELVLGPRQTGDQRAGQSAARRYRSVAGQRVCGPPRALLRARAAGSESGTLPGGAGAEAGSFGGIDAPGAMAGTGALVGQL
jgi:transposase